MRVNNKYVGLDLNKDLIINFKDEIISIDWLAEEEGSNMQMIFRFTGNETENIRDKLGLNRELEEDQIEDVEEFYYDTKTNIFLKSGLECTIGFVPLIEEDFDFVISSDRENKQLTMTFQYIDLTVKSLKKLIEQIESEKSKIKEIIYK